MLSIIGAIVLTILLHLFQKLETKTMKTKILLFSLLLTFTSKAQLFNFSVGQTAPDFTVTDIHGHTHHLSDYAGKWIMIDFFAYWCGPCAATAPIINEFYKKYGCNNYDIVVLALEGDGTTAQTVEFEETNGGDPDFPTPTVSGLDGGAAEVHTTYGPLAYPTIILVGNDGLIKNIDIWPISSVATIESAFTSAGASASMVVHSCAAAHVEELQLNKLAVYPNPGKGELNLSVSSSNVTELEIEIYSIQGTKLHSLDPQKISGGEQVIQLNLDHLSAGNYILQARTTEGFIAKSNFQIIK